MIFYEPDRGPDRQENKRDNFYPARTSVLIKNLSKLQSWTDQMKN